MQIFADAYGAGQLAPLPADDISMRCAAPAGP